MKFASRMLNFEESKTIALSSLVAQLKSQGKKILNMAAGEPDFNSVKVACDGAIDAIKTGKHKYTPVPGIKDLKTAIINKFANDNNICYNENQICVFSGAKQVIFNAIMALIEEGDEVIIPTPCWTSYPDLVKLFGGKVKFIDSGIKDKFKIDIDSFKKQLNFNTKMFILNSPTNPTGIVYDKSELEALGNILSEYPNVIVLSDEIYEYLIYDDKKFTSFVEACPKLKDRTIIVNGVSKAYAMTGWRIGYGAANEDITKMMVKIQSQSQSNTCSISQWAAKSAIENGNKEAFVMKLEFQKRRDLLCQLLSFKLPDCSFIKPNGAFYLFLNIEKYLGNKFNSDFELAEQLLKEKLLAVMPGSAFCASGYLRLSFATSEDVIKEAVNILADQLCIV